MARRQLAPPVTEERRSPRFTRRQVLVIVACMLVASALAGLIAVVNPPVYNTTRSIIVVSGANPNDNEVLTRALEALVNSEGLAAEVKRRGELPQSIDDIAGMISTSRPPESAYMDIIASHPEPEVSEAVSAQIVPALRGVFETAQVDLPVEQRLTGPVFREVFALPLQSTSSFPLWFALLFGALLGGLVPFLVFLVRNLRRPVIDSTGDVTASIGLPVLATVAPIGARGADAQDSVAVIVSAVDRLSLNEPVHRLLFVGVGGGVDRANLVTALACTIAGSFGQPVALIDADLEDRTLSMLLGATDVVGLAECLSGRIAPAAAMVALENLALPPDVGPLSPPEGMVSVLTAGVDTRENLLRMRSGYHRVLEELAGRFVIVVNGPSLPGSVPSSQLLSHADATLVVVTEGETVLDDARSAGDTLRSFGGGSAGVVMLRR